MLRAMPEARLCSLSFQHGSIDQTTAESVVNVVVADNLDLGCTIIERAATEKAIRDVDKLLQQAYDERIKARAQGKPFADNSPFHGRFPASLPESLRPRPGNILPFQLRVYEDFARIPRTPPPQTPGAASPGMPGAPPAQGVVQGMRPIFPGAPEQSMDKPLTEIGANATLLDKYLLWQGQADAAISAKEAQGPGADQSDLQLLLQELHEAVLSSGPAALEDSCSFFARRIFKHLFETSTKLHTTFYVACLQNLVEVRGRIRIVLEVR